MIRAALKNSSWLMSEKVFTMALNLIVTIVLARVLGPYLFGELNYVLALVAIVTPLTALGLNALVIRELVDNPKHETMVMTTVAAYRLIGAAVGLLGLVTWATVSDLGIDERLSLVIIGSAATLQAFQVVEYFFQAKVNAHYVVKMRALVVFIAGTLKLTCVFVYPSLLAIAIIYAFEYLAWGCGYILLYRIKGEAKGFKIAAINWNYGLKLLKQSFWLVLSGLAAVLYLKVDQVMLGELVSKDAVGTYAVAVRLSEVWYFFATAIAASFFSSLLQLKNSDNNAYHRRLQNLCDGLFTAAFVIAIAVASLASTIVPLLFGSEYLVSGTILAIHIWAGVFVFMRELASKWLIAEHLLRFSLLSHGAGALLNVILNLIFIPKWQGEGAAIATVLSYAMAGFIVFWFVKKTRLMALIMTRSLLLPFTLWARYWGFLKKTLKLS
ncbi:flippase [Pseudidiomarina aquimaris]|uniref:flippase n=1 Tax=Pseudidiomarina aquimaris TaxID=641841 RepID=UPI003A983A3E